MKLDFIMDFMPEEIESIATGFRELDRKTGGLRIGRVIAIGARPGMGKTAFAISMLRNIGVINKVPSAFLSLEHDEFEIYSRLKASLLEMPDNVSDESSDFDISPEVITTMEQIGFVKYDPHRRRDPQEVLQMMREAPVWIEPGISLDEIIVQMERLRQKNNVRIVFIDSLQWIDLAGNYLERSQALLKLNKAAYRLKVAVVLTTNIGRTGENRFGFKRPLLCDLYLKELKYSVINFSMVMFVYRPEYYCLDSFEDGTPSKDMADIMVEKNRYGGGGNVRMHFDNHVSFRELGDENVF